MDKLITIKDLSVNEVNTIIFALGKKPYEEVFMLIEKIQKQAEEQIKQPKDETDS